jgi:Mechanosensitive ion channel, conserved TM helix
MAEMITDAVGQAWTNFLAGLVQYLPRVLATLSIVLAGWIIAAVLRLATRWTLRWLRFDTFTERIGLAALLRAADLPAASVVVGSVVFWLVWLGFLLSGVDVLGLTALQGLVSEFGQFVPRLIVALAILVTGFVIGNIAWRATLLAAVNARVPSPRLLSNGVRALILILTVAMALDHVAIARATVLTAFAIAFGAVMLGMAIAFGIGGGGVARRFLEHQFPERPHVDSDDTSHV